ncbi:MAG: hypothetical protein NTW30_05875, partial [Candidatus Aenigmarchaeota archaeon]|nr:hypothetical protein [Candidatus Aenigmarchaeota archaeon]
MKEKKPRFSYHAKLHVKDKLFGSTMLMSTSAHASTMNMLINNFNVKTREMMRGMDQPRKISQKAIEELVQQMRDNGYSAKRIKNHFAKFDIDIYLPDEKKPPKLEKWQSTLEEVA